MSSSDRSATRRATATLLVAALALAGCTAGPLYGTNGSSPSSAFAPASGSIRGLVSISEAGDRTTQLVRNGLLTRLGGSEGATNGAPYELRISASGAQGSVVIEPVSGLPTASIYNISVSYQLVRLSDNKLIEKGTRTAQAPYDQSAQLFAADRAVVNARAEAAQAVAAKLELAVAAALRRAGR